MTASVGELVEQLGSSLHLNKAAGWDPVGLQFGDPTHRVSTLAVCHEVTTEVADQLIAAEVDLAVAYHPLLFRPVTSLVAGNSPAGRAFRLIANGVALMTVHTAFDVIAGGTADALADTVGLSDAVGFGPAWGEDSVKVITFAPAAAVGGVIEAMTAAGAGRIGAYSACSYRSAGVGAFFPDVVAEPVVGDVGALNQEPEERIEMIAGASQADAVVAALVAAHPYDEPAYDVVATRSNAGFIGRVGKLEEAMSVSSLARRIEDRVGGVIRVAGTGTVSTVAVIPGSGGSFVTEAPADVVVTGDVSHHQARAAVSSGVAIIDPGHAATERPGVKALYAALSDAAPTVIDMTDLDPDPWKEA
jgi:dinuclear metal center YbgI/SA1388 family protein